MSGTMKVYIVGSPMGVGGMFKNRGWGFAKNIAEADLVQFTGGEDISPQLYNSLQHPKTHPNPDRDTRELMAFKIANKYNKPMAGICRGGQLLNVLMGGKLYQHVNGHSLEHEVCTSDKETMIASSTHHQMMIAGARHELLMWANPNRATIRELVGHNGSVIKFPNNGGIEVEAVAYPNQNILCIQGHPEYNGYHRFTDKYFQYIHRYCLNRSM